MKAKQLLEDAYPVQDPFLWYYEDFGLIGWGESEENHIDINILRDFRQAESDVFTPQTSIDFDFQTRDFTINCLYYSVRDKVIYDPTDRALDDLNAKRLRFNAHEATYATNTLLTFRIVKFMLKSFSPDESCHDYLKSHMKKDDLSSAADTRYGSYYQSGAVLYRSLQPFFKRDG